MSSSSQVVIAFDLYGTLLSTESIAKELASHFGDKADSIASLWRRYQLEYTWRMNSMALYKPFHEVTRASLEHALADSDVELPEGNIQSLMQAYNSLSTFSDVEPALKALSADPSIDTYIFSNGTNDMVSTSVNQSPSLASFSSIFKDLITIEEVKVYKPDPRVYQYLAKRVGKSTSKEDMATIWLVSGNPFDVVGARSAGLKAAWIDRAGGGWNDKLGGLAAGGPTVVVRGVDDAVRAIRSWTAEQTGYR